MAKSLQQHKNGKVQKSSAAQAKQRAKVMKSAAEKKAACWLGACLHAAVKLPTTGRGSKRLLNQKVFPELVRRKHMGGEEYDFRVKFPGLLGAGDRAWRDFDLNCRRVGMWHETGGCRRILAMNKGDDPYP